MKGCRTGLTVGCTLDLECSGCTVSDSVTYWTCVELSPSLYLKAITNNSSQEISISQSLQLEPIQRMQKEGAMIRL